MQNKIVSDTDVIKELRGKIGDYTGYATRQYNTSCNSIIRQMDSLISKYSGEEYGGDVVAKARQIKQIASSVLRYNTDFMKQSEKILSGLKLVVNQYNATENECIGLVKKITLSKPSVRIMEKGINNFQTSMKQSFTKENVEELANLWENMFKEYNKIREDALEDLRERLANGNLPPLTEEGLLFYEQLPSILSELGISLKPKEQANLLSCLHIKGTVEVIDLKRFGLTTESGIDEKQLSELSKVITLKYDENYYKEKKAEELVSKLELFNSFIEDVNMNAIAIGEAGVDLGGALTNVFNTNLEENILLSPIYYTFTGFGEYIKGNMTHEETVEYFKRVIESLLIVEGGVKALEKGYTIVKKKLLTTPATGAVEGLNQVDDIVKISDDIIRYEKYWDDLVKRTDDIPPNWTPDEYQKYLNATEKVDAELALKKIDAGELIEARRNALNEALNEGAGKSVKQQMLETQSAELWGTLPDGTNQGVKHFADYWEKYPDRIPSLEERLGANAGDFANNVEGFNNFTNQAQNVINNATANGTVRQVNGKTIYYVDGVTKAKKGVVVICKDGKVQSMMPSDIKSFNKLQ